MIVIDPNSEAAREAEARALARREAWDAHLAKVNAEIEERDAQNKAREKEQYEASAKRERQELRDRFAMAALTGLLAALEIHRGYLREELADEAWAQADAMLKMRDAGEDEQ